MRLVYLNRGRGRDSGVTADQRRDGHCGPRILNACLCLIGILSGERGSRNVGLGCNINISSIVTRTKFQNCIQILGHYRYFF